VNQNMKNEIINQQQNIMQEWRAGFVGFIGLVGSLTVQQWSAVAAAIGYTLTALYMACKCWKEFIKPWLQKRFKRK